MFEREFSVILCVFVLLVIVQADSSLTLVKKHLPSRRLPTHLSPIFYKLHLDETKLGMVSGHVGIRVKVHDNMKVANGNSDTEEHSFGENFGPNKIVLHFGDPEMEIESIIFSMFPNGEQEGEPELVGIDRLEYDENYQLLAINLEKNLQPGSYGLLRIKFRVPLRKDMRGVFERTYARQDGGTNTYLESNFHPFGARFLFPCFDEPQFKATFDLSAIRNRFKLMQFNAPESGSTDLGRDNLYWTFFERTPPMSMDMLAFVVGPLAIVGRPSSESCDDRFKVRVLFQGGHSNSWKAGNYASDVACRSLEWMENYTGIAYEFPKFTIVALEEHERDFTPSWGLSLMRSNTSLLEDETDADSKAEIALGVARVVAHQWFGNLVSPKWWDSLWITESIATHLALEMARDLYPEFRDVLSDKQKSGSYTGRDVAGYLLQPNAVQLFEPAETNEIFNRMESTKGSILVRSMLNDLGKESLKELLRQLLKKKAYGSLDLDDIAEVIGDAAKREPSDFERFKAQLAV